MLRKQILINLFSNYVTRGIGMLLGLFILPFLIAHLGKDAFGTIVLAESIIIFFEVATISIRMALSRHATFALSKGKTQEFIEYLSTGRYLLYGSGAVVLIIGSFLSYRFSDIFQIPEAFMVESKVLFFLITIAFSITIPNIVYWTVLYAKQRYELINTAISCGLIFRAVLIFLLFSILPERFITLTTYGLIYLAMTWAQNMMVYIFHRRIMPGLKISWKHFQKKRIKEISSFSAYASLTRLSALLYDNTANIIINFFWGTTANAVYMVSLKFPTLMKRFFKEPTWSLTPTFTALVAQNEKDRLQLLFFMYTKVMSIIIIPACLFLIIISRPLIQIWVGEDFAEAGFLLPIHLVPLLISVPTSVCGCIIYAYAKVKVPSIVSLSAAVVNVVLGIVLGKVFSMGLSGIAIAAASSTLLYSILFMPYYSCKTASISLRAYWKKGFIAPLLWACVIMGCAFLIFRWMKPEMYVSMLSAGLFLLLSAGYFAGAYLLLFNATEKEQIRHLTRTLKKYFNRNNKPADTKP